MIDAIDDYGIYVNNTQVVEVVVEGGDKAFATLGLEEAAKLLMERYG